MGHEHIRPINDSEDEQESKMQLIALLMGAAAVALVVVGGTPWAIAFVVCLFVANLGMFLMSLR